MSEFLPITRLLRRRENVTWCKRGCFKRRICPIFRWLKVQRPQGHYYYYPGIYPDLDFGDFLKWDPMKELEGVLNLNIITSGVFFCGDQHLPSHDMPGWKVQEKGICGSGDGSGLPSFVVEDTLLYISSAHSLNASNTQRFFDEWSQRSGFPLRSPFAGMLQCTPCMAIATALKPLVALQL